MAVHNEHSLRSFPSFCENDNFEEDYDDDGDNNFVISLEDSGDDDDPKSTNVSATAYPATHTPYNSCLTSPHSVVTSSHPQNISIPYSTFTSSADNIGVSAYQQFVVPAPKNNYELEQCQSVYSTSIVNSWDCQTRSLTHSGLPVPRFHQDGMPSTISSSNGCGGSTFTAAEDIQPHKSPSEIGLRQFYHSQSVSQEQQSFLQQQLSVSQQQQQSASHQQQQSVLYQQQSVSQQQQQSISQQQHSFSQQQLSVSQQQQSFSQQQHSVSHQQQRFTQQQPVSQQHQCFSQQVSQQQPVLQQHQSFSQQQVSQQQPVSQQHQHFSQQQPVSQQHQHFSQQQPVSQQHQSFSQQQQSVLKQHQSLLQHHSLLQQQVLQQHQSSSQEQKPTSQHHQSVSQHQTALTTSSSDVPKMSLETIHLDRKSGGIWSEAVFLPSVGVSDSGFSDIATGSLVSPEGTSTVHDRCQITSTSPSTSSHNLLNISYFSTPTSRPVDTAHPVSEHVNEKSQKNHPFSGKAACKCIMCYKEVRASKQCQGNYSVDPVLTEEEMLLINEPTKRKRQYRLTGNSKRKKVLIQRSSDLGLQNQPALSNNCPKPQSLAACDIFTSGSTKQVGETPTSSSSVTSPDVSSPAMPRLVSAPVYRSNTTKVFLQPSEILSQRSQSVLPELTPMNKVTVPSNVKVALPTVTCTEAQQPCVSSSATLSTPPTYKIIYVRPDQVLVCPNKTSPSFKVVPLCKPPQTNTHQVTVLKFPQTVAQNKVLSIDSRQKAQLPTVVTHAIPKQALKNNNTITQSSLISKARNDLRNVLKNAEKIDISKPGKVLIKLQQSSNTSGLQNGGIQTPQTITNGASSPASKSSVYTTSLLKDFKLSPVKTTDSTASAQTSQPGNTTTAASSPGASKPTSHEITQALMCLIKSHFQGQTSTGSESILMNLIKGSLQTSESNNCSSRAVPPPQNVTVIGSNISNNCHKIATVQPIDKQKFKSPEKNIPESDVVYLNLDRVSSPGLPQEGLPSSYVEDWVNQTKTYVPDQLNTSDCLSELHPTLEPSPDDDTSYEHDDIKYKINAEMKSSMLEEREILVNSKLEPPSQLVPSTPTVTHHNLQITSPTPTSESSVDYASNICQSDIQRQVDQPPVSRLSAPNQNLQSFSIKRHSQAIADSHKSSHCKSSTQNGPIRSALCTGLVPNGHSHSVQTAATSMVMDSSKGIKLKIKLGDQRQENVSLSHTYNTLESSFKSSEGVAEPRSTNELSLLKRSDVSHQEVRVHEAQGDVSFGADGDKTETAEEMFQRFQKQAEQEVLKAQMGIGYLSRSLRPSRANVALTDNSPFVFGTGLPKKKIASEEKHARDVPKHLTGEGKPAREVSKHLANGEKNACGVSKHLTCEEKRVSGGSKHTGDNSSCCSLSEVDQQSSKYNTHSAKIGIRNKRPADELNSKGVKLKQAKLSIKDYPRLKQDGSITNRKKLYCANILAGHQVYVKFNTYENVVSGRVFLVPFFNIGGTRTQFDVEDVDYINRAVLEFEKDERSCARHLLFYAREGQKASFLRKETYFQASHIDDKNYRKNSFILEGFQRDTRKQTETSPEQWKVDHTIDIEIDRAEVDNDAEVEFDGGMTYGQLIHGLETHADGVAQTQNEHIFNRSEHERFPTENIQDVCENELSCLANQDTESTHAEVMVYNDSNNCEPVWRSQASGVKAFTQLRRMNMKDSVSAHVPVPVSLASAVRHSLVSSDKHIPARKALGLQYQYSGGDRLIREQLAGASPSTILQNGSHERDMTRSDEPSSCCAHVKLEEPDNGYDNSTNFVQNIRSTSISTNVTRNPCDLLIDKFNITVKSEPVDEYCDSQARITSCSSESGRLEHSATVTPLPRIVSSPFPSIVSCSHSQDSAIVHPTSKCVNFDSAKASSLSIADAAADQLPGHMASSPPSTHAGASHEPVAAPCTVTQHLSPSRTHTTDSTPTSKAEMTNSEVCQFEQSETDVRTDLNLDLVCDSVSASEFSSPELSSPKSPLPLSSQSVSSDVSSCSDIDDSLVAAETGSLHAGMPVPELTTQDGNNQGCIPNKITSLVESLRHRLTQDTSILPPWLGSPKIEMTKKKRPKANAKTSAVKLSSSSQSLPCETESSSVVASALSSTLDTSASATPALQMSLITPHPTDSDSLTTICCPSLPQDILMPVDEPLSPPVFSHNILNKNPMLLPVLQPTEQHQNPFMRCPAADSQLPHMSDDRPSSVDCASHKLVQKWGITETEVFPVTKEVSIDKKCTAFVGVNKASSSSLKDNPAFDGQDPSHCWEATLSDTGHSDLLDSFRRSPIDFEIEVGEEDLPETALSLQPILPNEVVLLQQSEEEDVGECFQIGHLQGSNAIRRGRATSRFADRTKQTKECLREESVQGGQLEKGSVASYLSQKFLFSGSAHRIKGPRLVHMRANSKASSGEPNIPKLSKVSIVPEPITVAELSQTPSVVEIFGASLRKKSAETPDTKGDSPETDISHNRWKSDSTEQNLPTVPVCPGKITNTKVTAKKKTSRMPIKPKHAPATKRRKPSSTQLPSSQKAVRSGLVNDLVSRMPVCKVVLTRLDILHINKLSENVFIIKTDSVAENHLPQTAEPENHSESGSQACSSSRSTSRKVLKKKRKKSTKETRRAAVRPKRDIVDYYASMLENLQKKAQLLEEESQRIAEENDHISVTTSCDFHETAEQKEPSGEENQEEAKKSYDEDNLVEMEEKLEKTWEQEKDKIKKTNEEVKKDVGETIEVKEERQISCEEVKGMESNIEMKSQVETLSNVQAEEDFTSCSSHPALCTSSDAANGSQMVSHNNITHTDCRPMLESHRVDTILDSTDDTLADSRPMLESHRVDTILDSTDENLADSRPMLESHRVDTILDSTDDTLADSRPMLESHRVVTTPDPTDHTQADTDDFGLQSEVSDSNWEFLQKFCNETILDQPNTDCLEKVQEEICFPKVAAVSIDELKFGKKDIVLSCSVGDEALATSEMLDGAEDPDSCLELQERDNLDDEEILLSIDIPKDCAFGHEDKEEAVKESFSLGLPSTVRHKLSPIGNESITDVERVHITSGKPVTSATPADTRAVLPSEPASTYAESSDLIIIKRPVNGADPTDSAEPKDPTASRQPVNGPEPRDPTASRQPVNIPEPRDSIASRQPVNGPEPRDSTASRQPMNGAEPRDPTISRTRVNGDHQPCSAVTQPIKQRNVEVSPSWERLLGQSSNIIQMSAPKNTCPEEPTNQNVSFVASSNFKGKFKLPKGILSKAIMMSRDMRNALDKPPKEVSPASNQEVDSSLNALQVSVSKVLEKDVSPNSGQCESSQSESLVDPVTQDFNLETAVASPIEPRLGPEELTVVQAKPELPPKRRRGRKPKQRLKARNQPQHVPAQSGDYHVQGEDILLKTHNRDLLDCDNLTDPRQELQARSAQFLDLENSRLDVKGENILASTKQCTADSATCKQSEDPVIQTKDNSQPVLPASTTTLENEPHTECVKQNRKDGIFSNIDFLCDLTDEPAAKPMRELPSNKQSKVDKILKNGVIDIRKLKLKLNPLITSKLKKNTGPLDVGMLPSQEGSVSVLALSQSCHTSVQDDRSSLQPLACKVSPKCSSPIVNILQSHDKLETDSSEQQPISASTDSPHHIPPSTNIQIPQVNTTKLCNFLKNFHKISSKAHNTDARDILPEGSGDACTSSSLSLQSPAKLDGLNTPASTSKVKGRKRGRKAKVAGVQQTNKLRKAKEEANKILAASSTAKLLDAEHGESIGDMLRNEDKGKRSFFDCLSTVPLHVWEDTQEKS